MNRRTSSTRRLTKGAILLALGAILPMAPSAQAHAPDVRKAPFSMEVLVDGEPLQALRARGKTYIEAIEGSEYSIRLRNNTSRRVAIALSVDGLNTIDAKTTSAVAASKWILAPYQSITLDGWQTSASTARRFFFTTEESSYGAWLGRTSRLGVISAAVFREREPRPLPILHQGKEGTSRRGAAAESPGAADLRSESTAEPDDDLAATGIGRRIGHDVRRVPFDHEPAPAAVMEVRYEYRDALVRLGVLPDRQPPCDDPIARRERAHGFEELEFAPDPYATGCP